MGAETATEKDRGSERAERERGKEMGVTER